MWICIPKTMSAAAAPHFHFDRLPKASSSPVSKVQKPKYAPSETYPSRPQPDADLLRSCDNLCLELCNLLFTLP